MKLKKILEGAMAGAMVLGSLSVVSANTVTVTNEAWWDAWTPTYEIQDGDTIQLYAELTAAGTEVYQNLNAVFVNVATDGVTAQIIMNMQYFVLMLMDGVITMGPPHIPELIIFIMEKLQIIPLC